MNEGVAIKEMLPQLVQKKEYKTIPSLGTCRTCCLSVTPTPRLSSLPRASVAGSIQIAGIQFRLSGLGRGSRLGFE
jgi:hypothetical protein